LRKIATIREKRGWGILIRGKGKFQGDRIGEVL